VDDPARSRRRCTGVGAAGHRGRRSTAGPSGCSGPAHRQRLHAVTRLVGVCEPDDIIANRLDPWHGAGFHPYSFTHLDVLTAPPVDDDLAEDADRFLVAVTFRIGRLRIPVVAEFTSPEPRTIVVRIVDGEGTGSVVETHATPVDPGADRRPRTAVLEAVIAHSDRTGFVQARKAGARPGVLADAVLLPQLVPETSPRADPVSRPRRTRRGRPTPQSRSLRPSVLTPRWPRPPANAPPTTTPAQLHQPARRPGHHLRQPCSARPRHASVHHDRHAHPASAVGLRTTRRLPASRPGVVSTPTPPDHSSTPNPSPNRELRANRRQTHGGKTQIRP
jgi:Domain of unknown function (DUF5914)